MQKNKRRRVVQTVLLLIVGVLVVAFAGCVRVSRGTWYFQSAATPQDWPPVTPINEVEVKDYPLYRAATVQDVDVSQGGMQSMFMTLFQHIKKNEIAMTAPVDIAYTDGDQPQMASMAFLYRKPDMGTAGADGAVMVEDLQPQTFASVGVRGDYNVETYQRGLQRLQAWMVEQDAYEPIGGPRYLGYNGPFVPTFWRYGEVQIPVQRTSGGSGQAGADG